MNFVQDFVGGGGCANGNSLSRFVNAAEKSSLDRDLWQREFNSQSNIMPNFDQRYNEPMVDGSEFLFGGPNLQQNDWSEFESVWQELPEENFQEGEFFEVNPIVNDNIRNFIHQMASGRPVNAIPMGIGAELTPIEKMKIRNRASTLARHFCTDERSIPLSENNLASLFNSLSINEFNAAEALHEGLNIVPHWTSEYENFVEDKQIVSRPFTQFDRIWGNEIEGKHEWLEDYKSWENYKAPIIEEEQLNRFNKVFDEIEKEATAENWINEYTTEDERLRAEEEKWFSQFISPSTASAMPRSNTGIAWVDEFHNDFQQDDVNGWIDQFSNMEQRSTLGNLTDEISKIPHPKLQSSNFMKFVKQINSGEVQLDDLATTAATNGNF